MLTVPHTTTMPEHLLRVADLNSRQLTDLLDLAGALVATTFAVVELLAPTRPSHLPGAVHFSTLIPRAPPATTHPVMFWEGCVGRV